MTLTILLLNALVASGLSDGGCWVRGARADLGSRMSSLDSAVAQLGTGRLKVCYSRPSVRGRTIMGGLVPFGEPWRLGANEAATIHIPVAAQFGDVKLKPGVYSLYAIPGAKTWQLVVNDSATRWGIPIDAAVRAHDVGSVTVPAELTQAPVEALAITLEPGASSVALIIEWERTRVRATLRPEK